MRLAALSLSLACSLALLTTAVAAQAPTVTVHERVIADLGTTGLDYTEPALAMTRRRQFGAAVPLSAPIGVDRPVHALIGTNQSGSWMRTVLTTPLPPPAVSFPGADLSIAVVDASADEFVLFGLGNPFNNGTIRYRTWSPVNGFSPDWVIAFQAPPNLFTDKPWVLRRAAGDFLLFWWAEGTYRYLRTNDGNNWRAPGGGFLPFMDVATTPPDEPVTTAFCCHPSTSQDGRVFLSHVNAPTGPPPSGANGFVRILMGHDPEGNTSGSLSFQYMRSGEGALIQFQPRHPGGADLPVACPAGYVTSRMVPTIACDPSDPGRAYIVYHDVAADDASDVNVYLARLTRTPLATPEQWNISIGTVVSESTSLFGVRGDQFCP